MLLVRVLTATVKPALAGGIVAASIAGGALAWDRWSGDDVTAFQRIQGQGQHLLVSEFGTSADTIYAVDAADTSSRKTIARITHADGWGIFATVSPDGDAIAYTALPPDEARPSPAAPAQAAVIDAGGDTTLLAEDIDLLIPPVWSPDSGSIVVRRNIPEEDSAGSFELVLLGRDGARSVITTWHSAALFPIAFSPDGASLYFATLNASGSDLFAIAPDGSGEELVAHLSDDIARDWRLSPDGTTLAYTIAERGAEPRVVTMMLDIATGAATVASGDAGRAEFNPTWSEDGSLTIASVDAGSGGDARAVRIDAAGDGTMLPAREGAVDLPLTWSPNGDALVVRAIEGAGDGTADAATIDLVREDGTRERVSKNADAQIVGWVE